MPMTESRKTIPFAQMSRPLVGFAQMSRPLVGFAQMSRPICSNEQTKRLYIRLSTSYCLFTPIPPKGGFPLTGAKTKFWLLFI